MIDHSGLFDRFNGLHGSSELGLIFRMASNGKLEFENTKKYGEMPATMSLLFGFDLHHPLSRA